jgi:hypothetical protein
MPSMKPEKRNLRCYDIVTMRRLFSAIDIISRNTNESRCVTIYNQMKISFNRIIFALFLILASSGDAPAGEPDGENINWRAPDSVNVSNGLQRSADRARLLELIGKARTAEYKGQPTGDLERQIDKILIRYSPDEEELQVLSARYGIDFQTLPDKVGAQARIYYNVLDKLRLNFHAGPSPLDEEIDSYIIGEPVRFEKGDADNLPLIVYDQLADSYEDEQGYPVLGVNLSYVIEINRAGIGGCYTRLEKRTRKMPITNLIHTSTRDKLEALTLLQLLDLRAWQDLIKRSGYDNRVMRDLYVNELIESSIIHERAEQNRTRKLTKEQRVEMETNSFLAELASPGLSISAATEIFRTSDHPGAHGKAVKRIKAALAKQGMDEARMKNLLIESPRKFTNEVSKAATKARDSR